MKAPSVLERSNRAGLLILAAWAPLIAGAADERRPTDFMLAQQPPTPATTETATHSGLERARVPAALHTNFSLPRLTRQIVKEVNTERLALGKVRAIVEHQSLAVDASNLGDLARSGATIVEQVRATAELTTLPYGLAAAQPPGTKAMLLSQEVIVPNAAGIGVVRMQAFIRDTSGLVYSTAERAFKGTVLVALWGKNSEPEGTKLGRRVAIMLMAPGAKLIEPLPAESDVLGHWQPVRLVIPMPADPFVVQVSADPEDPGDRVELPVIRPQVTLTPTTPRIVGWGLGKTTILVDAPGHANDSVTVRTSLGQIAEPAKLDDAGLGRVELRSAEQGGAQLSVAPPYTSDRVTVLFASPLPFLGLALAGGLAGGALGRRRRQPWSKVLALGALTGLVMAAAYFVGVDWVVHATGWNGLATAGEAVVAVIGVLGALVGSKVLLKT